MATTSLISCSQTCSHTGATSKGFRESSSKSLFRSVQVFIEYHGDVSDEHAAERRDLDALFTQAHELITFQLSQTLELSREVMLELDAESAVDFRLDDDCV